MKTASAVEIEDLSPEAQKVFEWRLSWLESAGYSHENAMILARNFDINYKFANELLKNCADQEKAMEILL